jgi:hypothetical protein
MDNISLKDVQVVNVSHSRDGGRKLTLEVNESQIITAAKLSALPNDLLFDVTFKQSE